MPISIKCTICGKEKLVRPCQKDIFKTCGSKECVSKYASIRAKKQFAKYGHNLDYKKIGKRNSKLMKKRYKDGKMEHMKGVWRDNSQRWADENNPRWKAIGSKRMSNGYVYIKTRYGWIQEHRLVAEKIIGRELKRSEVIHHINRIKDDNRPENLYLMTDSKHRALHTLDNINKDKGLIQIKLKSNLII